MSNTWPRLIQSSSMKKIFCFGDGFATGHIWPEWPQILQALVPDYQVVITAGIGAGSEFLVSGFVDQICNMRDSIVIFQWPQANRFDKLIEDASWKSIIAADPVYHFNVVHDMHDRNWWLSSASKDQTIIEYHGHYVQGRQHQRRQQVYQELVLQTASNLNCQLIHTSTEQQQIFSMSNRFKSSRTTEIQPSPVVHFYWLVEKVIPQCNIVIDFELQSKLEASINQTEWIAYHPDREEIWNNIKQKLNV